MTISETIFRNLPYLDPFTDVQKVLEFSQEVMLIMQTIWANPISDVDVLNEAVYSEKQKLVIAYYTCFNLITEKSISKTSGIAGADPQNRVVVSEKADVVSQDYKVIGEKEGMAMGTETMLSFFRQKACTLAYTFGISLPICLIDKSQYESIPVMFFPSIS